MKKLVLTFITIFMISCSNDDISTETQIIRSSIKTTETLEIELGGIPVEGGVSITRQATNYFISEIGSRQNGLVYTYEPKEGFTGVDQVEITRSNSNGAQIYSTSTTVIFIEISE